MDRYEEALERAKTFNKRWQDVHATDSELALKELKEIFPELAESDDEKIRKSLLEYLHTLPNHYSHSGVCAPEWIAWLEKQGQKKSIDDLTQQEAMDIAVAKCFEQGEQNHAWSEKDLEMLSSIELDLSMLMAKNPDYKFRKLYQEEIDWLKSIRPQNRWKPSGFYLECISDAIAMYEERGINAIGLKDILEELKKM